MLYERRLKCSLIRRQSVRIAKIDVPRFISRTPWNGMLQNSIRLSVQSNQPTTGAKGLSVSRNGYVNFLGKTKQFGWILRMKKHNASSVKEQLRHLRFP